MRYLVEMVLKATDRATAPIRGVRKQMDRLRGRVAAFSRSVGFHRISDSVKGLTGPLGRLRSSISGLLGPIGALVSFGSVALFAGWISSSAAAADEMAKFAARTGLGVEQVQEFEFAMGKMAGASREEVRTGLRDLVKNIGEAASGASTEMQGLFKALKIDPDEVKNNTGKALALLADRFERIPDAATRAAVAQRLFGESGAKMAEALHQGRDAIREQAERMRRFGLVSEKGAAEAERHADRMADLTAAFSGFGVSIQETVLPVIGPFIERLTDLVAANRDLIATDIAGFAKDLSEWLFGAADAAGEFAKATEDGKPALGGMVGKLVEFVKWIAPAVDAVGGFKTILAALGLLIAGPFLVSLGLITKAVFVLGAAILTTPIGWIVGGIAALVAAGLWLYDTFEPVQRLFDGMFEGLSEKWNKVTAAFDKGFVQGIMTLLDEFDPTRLLVEAFMGFVKWIGAEWGDEMLAALSAVGDSIAKSKWNPANWSIFGGGDDEASVAGGGRDMAPPPFVSGRIGNGTLNVHISDDTGRARVTGQQSDGLDLQAELETGAGYLAAP